MASILRRFLFRENRVPMYQRMFLENKDKRLWSRTPRAKYFLYPYYVILFGTLAASQYQMVRMILGHKTWFGKD